ncbi:MAG: hypothetical protein J6T10_29890 [Methanobrevibacter sp.]|nr:hypothetical protein [Methanobrevibacter sp.]
MNDVILIREFIHGDVGVAADYKSAIYYLIKEGWIDDYTDIYDENKNRGLPISEVLGKNWRTTLLNANEDWFNDTFLELFRLRHAEIYKYK